MTVSEHVDGIFQEHGTIHYRYKYTTEDGEEFIIGASLEGVPEALRGRLEWAHTRLKLRLNDLVIDIYRELEK